MFFAACCHFFIHVKSSFTQCKDTGYHTEQGQEIASTPFYRQLAQTGCINFSDKRKTKSKVRKLGEREGGGSLRVSLRSSSTQSIFATISQPKNPVFHTCWPSSLKASVHVHLSWGIAVIINDIFLCLS
jgi:hypothetical protein